MADVKWVKIVTDIFDDDKILLIESMPESDALIVIWFKLLCLAGKQNNSGVFLLHGRIPYTDEMFATIFRRPLNTVRLALKTFQEFGMIEIINDTVTIPNWGKHQTLDKIEAKTAYMRGYMRQYREKQKALSSGQINSKANSKAKVSEADKNKNKNNNKCSSFCADEQELGLPMGFLTFWSAYPKKVSKKDAVKAWKSLAPNDELVNRIVADVQRRCAGEWAGKDRFQYIPYPATYLRKCRWEDDLPPTDVEPEYRPTIQEIINERVRQNGGNCIVPGFDKPFGSD